MMLDVFSRKIVGHEVHRAESAELAALLMRRASLAEGLAGRPLVLHSDNGSPMKGATMLATLENLGVVASFSRPRVSNDNPYAESLFRTCKYRPDYPGQAFGSDGVPVTVIRNSAGFVAQRIVCTIVNVASDIAQQRIATPADIDLALNLGLGYPKGPLALGDARAVPRPASSGLDQGTCAADDARRRTPVTAELALAVFASPESDWRL
ncbi:3-hydroxyacyl-CoA dehydrogenase (plasmid) [Cupriavidus necator H850]|nr:3-hydroxyacyl-CoA dehydrogenase [Cupriavidus necator H850]